MSCPATACPALPVTGVSVSAWYCHHHLAWHAMSSRYTQGAEESISPEGGNECSFGPFDDAYDVISWMRAEIEWLMLLGVTGDRLL